MSSSLTDKKEQIILKEFKGVSCSGSSYAVDANGVLIPQMGEKNSFVSLKDFLKVAAFVHFCLIVYFLILKCFTDCFFTRKLSKLSVR